MTASLGSRGPGDEERADAPVRGAVGRVVAGKYRLDRLVGTGGMGTVWAATHLGLHDRFAVKLLSARSSEAAARLLREARLAAGIKSEHVVRVFDVGTDDGAAFVVMELLEGENLADLLRARGKLDVDEAVDLFRQACEGLAAAHARGIVHRDLKPSNLFLARAAHGRPTVKLVDFGVAKELEGAEDASGAVTAATTILGSPFYMAPEQVRVARDVDARADVWSLGVTLFELLTGRVPFDAPTTPGVLAAIVADDAPRVTELRPDAPPWLARVVARCLAKDPADRWPDARALGDALARAKPRSRAPLAAAGALAAIGLAGIALVAARGAPSADARPITPELLTTTSAASATSAAATATAAPATATAAAATATAAADAPPPTVPPRPIQARAAISAPTPTPRADARPPASARAAAARPDIGVATADRK